MNQRGYESSLTSNIEPLSTPAMPTPILFCTTEYYLALQRTTLRQSLMLHYNFDQLRCQPFWVGAQATHDPSTISERLKIDDIDLRPISLHLPPPWQLVYSSPQQSHLRRTPNLLCATVARFCARQNQATHRVSVLNSRPPGDP